MTISVFGGAVKGITDLISKGIDKAFPDPEEAARVKAMMLTAETDASIRHLTAQLSAIITEAQSDDPWTSRARPSFLYVVYVFLLAALPMGFVSAFNPEIAGRIAAGVSAWLSAIPEPMWALFGVGYLGYTGMRSMDKRGAQKAAADERRTLGGLLE